MTLLEIPHKLFWVSWREIFEDLGVQMMARHPAGKILVLSNLLQPQKVFTRLNIKEFPSIDISTCPLVPVNVFLKNELSGKYILACTCQNGQVVSLNTTNVYLDNGTNIQENNPTKLKRKWFSKLLILDKA